MKKQLLISSIILVGISLLSLDIPDQPLTGKWEGTVNGNECSILFNKEFVTFRIGEEILGDKDFETKDSLGVSCRATMTFKIDTAFVPKHIDFIIRKNGNGKEIARIKGIYEFPRRNRLKIIIDLKTIERPKIFEPENTLFLDKVVDED